MLPWTTPAFSALLDLALEEDLGRGDCTTLAVTSAQTRGEALLVAREDLTVAGIPVAEAVFKRVDPSLGFTALVTEGARVAQGTPLAAVEGRADTLLQAERTALNFLQRLCGVATLTTRFVKAVGEHVRVADTRKTTPGYRALEKYAVRIAGGSNHRADLASGVLIKDNHIALAGGIREALRHARKHATHSVRVEIEVDTLEQLDEVLEETRDAGGCDIVLLDNFSNTDLAIALEKLSASPRRPLVEISGGITLETIGERAVTGVDIISVGALTHSAVAVDIGLDIAP